MAKRSLQASQEGAKLARKIFERRGWTQEGMAAELELRTRQPIWRFFTCRPIERYIFIELCTILDLNWWEIADQVPEPLLGVEHKAEERSIGPKQWVEQIRLKHQDRIDHQCATLRVLGMSRPTQLVELYVMPHLFDQLADQEHLEITQLEESYSNTLSNLREQRVRGSMISLASVLQNYPMLRILGKPGSGKTTVLKWIALQCNLGKFQPDLIPVVIKLGNYTSASTETTEFSLLACLQQEMLSSNVADHQVIETLLNEGRFLLLVDELEVAYHPGHINLILREVGRFSERYHRNRIILTSRLGRSEFELLNFTDFELMDFNNDQIGLLVQQWFSVFEPSAPAEALAKTEACMNQLQLGKNQRIRELAGVPLFLNRICQVFQSRGNLYKNRTKIYEECLALVLDDWRQQYDWCTSSNWRLNVPAQISLLSRIAASMLEKGQYFLEQSELDECIVINLTEVEELNYQKPSGEAVALIRSSFLQRGILLEQAYGIVSFSNLAFQEYLVFRKIIASPPSENNLADLFSHLTDVCWQEVFLLVSSKWPDRTVFMQKMGSEIRSIVAKKPRLEDFLNQLQQKSCNWLLYCQITEAKTLLCQLVRTPSLLIDCSTLIIYIDTLAQILLLEVILTKLVLWLAMSGWQNTQISEPLHPFLSETVRLALSDRYPRLTIFLDELRVHFSQHDWNNWAIDQWKDFQVEWLDRLTNTLSEYCQVGETARFDVGQLQLLQKYLYVVQLFADCQNQGENCSVSDLQALPANLSRSYELKEAAFWSLLESYSSDVTMVNR